MKLHKIPEKRDLIKARSLPINFGDEKGRHRNVASYGMFPAIAKMLNDTNFCASIRRKQKGVY